MKVNRGLLGSLCEGCQMGGGGGVGDRGTMKEIFQSDNKSDHKSFKTTKFKFRHKIQ